MFLFGEAIEMADPSVLTPDTNFKELDDWSSMGV